MTTLPTIHLNGTGADSLLEEYAAAADAANLAIGTLAQATCNARDFYPQGDAAWSAARAEREAALTKLREVHSYLMDWAVHAADHAL
jgi:hypothetical protein